MTCPRSLSQEVGHHGVPHTRTPDHAQGGMVSDLCMMGDVHPGGGSPPPAPTKVNSLHGTLDLIPAATRVHTTGGTMCATTEKLPSIRISSRLFSFLSLSCKNASFADKQKAEGPSQSLLYLLRALTGVPHCRKMFFRIFSPKFLKSKEMLKHSTKTK